MAGQASKISLAASSERSSRAEKARRARSRKSGKGTAKSKLKARYGWRWPSRLRRRISSRRRGKSPKSCACPPQIPSQWPERFKRRPSQKRCRTRPVPIDPPRDWSLRANPRLQPAAKSEGNARTAVTAGDFAGKPGSTLTLTRPRPQSIRAGSVLYLDRAAHLRTSRGTTLGAAEPARRKPRRDRAFVLFLCSSTRMSSISVLRAVKRGELATQRFA